MGIKSLRSSGKLPRDNGIKNPEGTGGVQTLSVGTTDLSRLPHIMTVVSLNTAEVTVKLSQSIDSRAISISRPVGQTTTKRIP